MHWKLVAAAAAIGWISTPAFAQSAAKCNALLNQKITASGIIERTGELDDFLEFYALLDRKTGCRFVVIEGILGSKCRKGATATVTGTVKRFAEALEIDPGGGASSSCR